MEMNHTFTFQVSPIFPGFQLFHLGGGYTYMWNSHGVSPIWKMIYKWWVFMGCRIHIYIYTFVSLQEGTIDLLIVIYIYIVNQPDLFLSQSWSNKLFLHHLFTHKTVCNETITNEIGGTLVGPSIKSWIPRVRVPRIVMDPIAIIR